MGVDSAATLFDSEATAVLAVFPTPFIGRTVIYKCLCTNVLCCSLDKLGGKRLRSVWCVEGVGDIVAHLVAIEIPTTKGVTCVGYSSDGGSSGVGSFYG